MKEGLIITCQVMENKAWYEGGEAWSPAGGFVFHVEVELSEWMYNEDGVREAIERVVTMKGNNCERFEVVSIDYQFTAPEDITADFKAAYEVAEVVTDGPEYSGPEDDFRADIGQDYI